MIWLLPERQPGEWVPTRNLVSWLGAALFLSVVVIPWLSVADEQETAPEFLVVMADQDSDTRTYVEQRLIQVYGPEVVVSWLEPGELGRTWSREELDVGRLPVDGCEGDPVDATWVTEQAELALHLVTDAKVSEARDKAELVESRWACLEEVVTPNTLQRTALVRAWVELLAGDGSALEEALRQAAVVDAKPQEAVVKLLPEDLWETFQDFQAEVEHLPSWEIQIDTEGLPVEVFVDGVVCPSEDLGGGIRRSTTVLRPGRHLLQVMRLGARTESVVLRLAAGGGSARVHAVTPVPETEAMSVFEMAISNESVPWLLAQLLSAHPVARGHSHILLARVDRAFEQERWSLVPILRPSPGEYNIDEDLDRVLADRLDATAGAARLAEKEPERRGPPGAWHLWAGASVGIGRIHGYTYAMPALEVGLETPLWISGYLRPGLALGRESYTYVQGGAAGILAFTPRVKRIRFLAGVGGEVRGPDYRFEGTGIHPIAVGGVGVRLGNAFFLTFTADIVLYKVHDAGIRLAFTREFGLARKKKPAATGRAADDEPPAASALTRVE